MTLSTLEILKWGREVIANPETFTTGQNARDAWGGSAWNGYDTISPRACRFCSAGFFWAAHQFFRIPKKDLHPAHKLLSKAAGGQLAIISTNNKGQLQAIAMWDRAIAICEREGT